jgi:hypothetical protein
MPAARVGTAFRRGTTESFGHETHWCTRTQENLGCLDRKRTLVAPIRCVWNSNGARRWNDLVVRGRNAVRHRIEPRRAAARHQRRRRGARRRPLAIDPQRDARSRSRRPGVSVLRPFRSEFSSAVSKMSSERTSSCPSFANRHARSAGGGTSWSRSSFRGALTGRRGSRSADRPRPRPSRPHHPSRRSILRRPGSSPGPYSCTRPR